MARLSFTRLSGCQVAVVALLLSDANSRKISNNIRLPSSTIQSLCHWHLYRTFFGAKSHSNITPPCISGRMRLNYSSSAISPPIRAKSVSKSPAYPAHQFSTSIGTASKPGGIVLNMPLHIPTSSFTPAARERMQSSVAMRHFRTSSFTEPWLS